MQPSNIAKRMEFGPRRRAAAGFAKADVIVLERDLRYANPYIRATSRTTPVIASMSEDGKAELWVLHAGALHRCADTFAQNFSAWDISRICA